ncbi:hypothetical protein SAMN04488090_1545 [Siphonobacter aquaeclarae]|uniref:Uncharacterized protein n=1 Tax=Siphonobacter aquaeclarae TaxID=563176 RepID=A0A1G9ME45_9BACT|nr:hypothetical protein SAMN04488090_1545 [Siphonobacter aquaeclarae]
MVSPGKNRSRAFLRLREKVAENSLAAPFQATKERCDFVRIYLETKEISLELRAGQLLFPLFVVRFRIEKLVKGIAEG